MSEFLARNIINQIGDLLMEVTSEGTPERIAFVKHRQATNDHADEFVQRMLTQHDAEVAAKAFESGARSYAAVDPCCGTYHLHEIDNPHTGEPIPTRDGEDDL